MPKSYTKSGGATPVFLLIHDFSGVSFFALPSPWGKHKVPLRLFQKAKHLSERGDMWGEKLGGTRKFPRLYRKLIIIARRASRASKAHGRDAPTRRLKF